MTENSIENQKAARPGVHRVRHVSIRSVKELGALVRTLRAQLGFTQTEAAALCGVGRRWYVEFENGKDTIRLGMAIRVLEAFGAHLSLTGADLTDRDLLERVQLKDEGEHVWEAEFEAKRMRAADAAERVKKPAAKRGPRTGSVRSGAPVAENRLVRKPAG